MSLNSTPIDITLQQPQETEPGGFAAGSQIAQALLDRMRKGTDADDLFRTVVLAVRETDQARGLCNTVQEVLKTFGLGAAEAQAVAAEAQGLREELIAALTLLATVTNELAASKAYVNETDAKRRALIDEATAVLEDVKAAVPRKLLKVERAVEFVTDADGQIIGAAVVLGGGSPQPGA